MSAKDTLHEMITILLCIATVDTAVGALVLYLLFRIMGKLNGTSGNAGK